MNKSVNLAIVGGGLSGILLALKLSSSEKYKNKSITLIDEQPSLGGRFFFASARSFLGKSRPQIYEELLQDAHDNKFLSGFGFELLDLQIKESLFRHIQNSLSEEENMILEQYLAKFESHTSHGVKNNCYFVKKEFTSIETLLNTSSEILTKKEADYLNSLLHDETDIQAKNDKKTFLELSKQAKESLAQIFETIVGVKWESIPFAECCSLLKQHFLAEKNNYFLPFQRQVALELFLEKILLNRGVEIRNLCRLVRVEQQDKKIFSLVLNDEIEPDSKHLQTEQLVLSLPLTKCAGLLPKELYSPEQSKFVSRIQPMSLVVYELSHFSSLQAPSMTASLNAYDKLAFPVERVNAFYTADNRMLFYSELDYEDSLQAPAVRESVARLKRAAARILNEDILKEIKKGFRMPQTQFTERVILLPVAQTIPYYTKMNFELKQVKMGVPNLYCCGDSFFSLASEPWKRIIHSIQDVVQGLVGIGC